MPTTATRRSQTASRLLFVLQVLLAGLFVFAGVFKLVTPIAAMTQQMPRPGAFLRIIGVAELAGGLGLILPGAFRLWPVLTPLAAGGLVLIMTGAVGVTLATGGASATVVPGVVAILASIVAVGRWPGRVVPTAPRAQLALQAA